MLKKVVLIITAVSLCLLALVLTVTAPSNVGPFGILVVFILAYMSSLGVVAYFLYYGSRLAAHLASAFSVRQPVKQLTFRRSYYYSTVLAAAPIMIVGLQSVGSVGLYEVLLVIGFIVIGCLYIAKRIR